MWIFSQDGFVSAVEKKSGIISLRARDRESLTRMGFKGKRIKTGEGTDYPFRVETTKAELKVLVCKQIDEIDYPNFKSRLKVSRGQRFESAAHRVWSAMLSVEPRDALTHLTPGSWRRPRKRKGGSRAWDWERDFQSRADRDVPSVLDLDLADEDLEGMSVIDTFDDRKIGDLTESEWERFCEEQGWK